MKIREIIHISKKPDAQKLKTNKLKIQEQSITRES